MSGLLVARRGSLHRSGAAAADAYAAEVTADSPIAWWRFSETSGSTVVDQAGTNDGTVYGATLNVAGPSGTGSAASFDGVDDWVEIGDAAVFDVTRLTLECWVKNPGAGRPISRDTASSTDRHYLLTVSGSGYPAVILWTGTTIRVVEWASSIVDGSWHHIVATYDGSVVRLYVDKVERGSTAATGDIRTGAGYVSLAATDRRPAVSGQDGFTDVDLDEPAIYDYALSPARIAAHYDAGVA